MKKPVKNALCHELRQCHKAGTDSRRVHARHVCQIESEVHAAAQLQAFNLLLILAPLGRLAGGRQGHAHTQRRLDLLDNAERRAEENVAGELQGHDALSVLPENSALWEPTYNVAALDDAPGVAHARVLQDKRKHRDAKARRNANLQIGRRDDNRRDPDDEKLWQAL